MAQETEGISASNGASARPLEGVRVIELGQVISAPYAGLLLADLGAEVIKVEQPGIGDSARNPEITGMGEVSATFVTFNRNKRSIALDLKDEADYDAFAAIARSADVVLCNMVPSVATRLRVDPDSLSELNSQLVVCMIQGFASDDPRRNEPSYDLTHQAMTGLMLMEGLPGDPPLRVSIPIADLLSAHFAVYAILASLYARDRTGAGEHLEVPMYDSMLSALTYTATLYLNDGKEPQRMGSEHEYSVPWQAVEARDGSFVLAVRAEKFWQRLCQALGKSEWLVDERFSTNERRLRNRVELARLLNEALRSESVAYWVEHLRSLGVPTAPVRTVGQALDEIVLTGSDLIAAFDQPGYGAFQVVGNPVRFSRMTKAVPAAAPALGEFAPATAGLLDEHA
jgi:formyl-CoA transferase